MIPRAWRGAFRFVGWLGRGASGRASDGDASAALRGPGAVLSRPPSLAFLFVRALLN
jgi:hypothetical protein